MTASPDPRAVMGAANNADWYAMMWDLRGLRYIRDAWGFRAIDPPMPYHGWVTAVHGAPVEQIARDHAATPDFAIKDASGVIDLSGAGLVHAFSATWLWHPSVAGRVPDGWERITRPDDLALWCDAWAVTSPVAGRQFPDEILARADVAIFGRRAADGFGAGFIANRSVDCVGLSNSFGAGSRAAATQVCSSFSAGLPLVGYEQGDDLAEACDCGWSAVGDLRVWVREKSA